MMRYLLMLLCLLGATNAAAQTKPPPLREAPRVIELPPTVLPKGAHIAERRFVQLAWNADQGRLERVALVIDDPLASEELALSWQTKAQVIAPGRLTGKGRLSWRIPGTRPYDPAAEVASFGGQIIRGAFAGLGRFWHRSGTVYIGGWSNGLMEGQGQLKLGDGRSYDVRHALHPLRQRELN